MTRRRSIDKSINTIINWIEKIIFTYTHQNSTENEHEQKISGFPMIIILFQHPTIAIGKNEVEEEVEPEGTEVKEGGD